MVQKIHPLTVPCWSPMNSVKGPASFPEILPVMAKTIKMAIISHLWATGHLFANFLKHQRKNRISRKYITKPTTKVNTHSKMVLLRFKRCKSLLAIVYAVSNTKVTPKNGKKNCQFSVMSQRFLIFSIK